MSSFQVSVSAVGKEAPLRGLRLIADISLREALALSNYLRAHAPCVLVAGVSEEVANHAVGLLRESGCAAAAETSSLERPMLLCPEVNQRRKWSWLGGLKVI
jgi:hypothetical protein